MAFINKQDTNGTKGTLLKGELGYDDYTAGGDTGRVYVGNGSTNIALAKKTEVDAKQVTLVSGTNIKTVNSTTLLGSGNVAVQPTLVSGTNIKTVGGTSILGSGDIAIGLTDAGHSFGSNGYQKLSNGLIIQWGEYTATMTHGTSYTATFPVAFTNSCLQVDTSVSNTMATVTTVTYCPLTAKTTSNFTFQYGSINGGSYATTVRYIAIGY